MAGHGTGCSKPGQVPPKSQCKEETEVITVTMIPIDVSGTGVIGSWVWRSIYTLRYLAWHKEGFLETFYVSPAWITGIIGMIVGKIYLSSSRKLQE